MNAGWFKKHPCHHYAYHCEVCEGWHLATIKDEHGRKVTDGRDDETQFDQ